MTGRELRERGFLYFEAIREGLDSYENEIVAMDGREAFEHFLGLKEKYGEDNSFLDFYLFSLSPKERERAEKELTGQEIRELKRIEQRAGEKNGVIFPMEEGLLQAAVRLNETEMLFSSMYFRGTDENGRERAETWWGNYGKQYVRFWK